MSKSKGRKFIDCEFNNDCFVVDAEGRTKEDALRIAQQETGAYEEYTVVDRNERQTWSIQSLGCRISIMNKAILKISKDMWKEIKSGNKVHEIRKLNKDYIQEGFIIKFVDMVTGYNLGERKVLKKKYWVPRSIVTIIKHGPTVDFVKANYMDEIRLIVFELDCGQYVKLDGENL